MIGLARLNDPYTSCMKCAVAIISVASVRVVLFSTAMLNQAGIVGS